MNSWSESFQLLKSIDSSSDLEKGLFDRFLKEAAKRGWKGLKSLLKKKKTTSSGGGVSGASGGTKHVSEVRGKGLQDALSGTSSVSHIDDAYKIKAKKAAGTGSTRVLDLQPQQASGTPAKEPSESIRGIVKQALSTKHPVGSKEALSAEKASEEALKTGTKHKHLTEYTGEGRSLGKKPVVGKKDGITKIAPKPQEQLAAESRRKKLLGLSEDYGATIKNATDLHKIMKNPVDSNNLRKIYTGKTMSPELRKIYETYMEGGGSVSRITSAKNKPLTDEQLADFASRMLGVRPATLSKKPAKSSADVIPLFRSISSSMSL